jgi:hypothetical protein
VRELLIKQRTMTINALRGLMAEFGIVVAQGPHHVGQRRCYLCRPFPFLASLSLIAMHRVTD